MLEKVNRGGEIQPLINKLWKDYPNGFVAHIKKGNVPELWMGLARYLVKYVACPLIAVANMLSNGITTIYMYDTDHFSRFEEIEVLAP